MEFRKHNRYDLHPIARSPRLQLAGGKRLRCAFAIISRFSATAQVWAATVRSERAANAPELRLA